MVWLASAAGTALLVLRRGLPLALLGLLAAAPAGAAVRPLSGRAHVETGPVLVGDRAVYADRLGHRAVRVLAQPLAGGPRAELARVPVPRSRFADWPFWDFDAAPGALALRVGTVDGPRRLWAGPGPLALVQRRARPGPQAGTEQSVFAVPGGPLLVERAGGRLHAILRPPGGPARALALPAGADLHHLAVAGSLAAVPAGDAIVLLDLPSGAVRRRVALGPFAGTRLEDLAVSAAGDVALTVEDSTGADFLGWAPAGSAAPRVVLGGDRFGFVATAGGRIAMEQPAAPEEGARVVALDPDSGGVLFTGPPAAAIRSLDYDGAHVAWSTDGCQLVADATAADSADRVPAGPCIRTEATFGVFNDEHPSGHPAATPVQVRCLTAPTARCRVDLRLYNGHFKRLGRRFARVPVGQARIVRVRAPRQPRRALVFMVARVIDPGGHRRIAAQL